MQCAFSKVAISATIQRRASSCESKNASWCGSILWRSRYPGFREPATPFHSVLTTRYRPTDLVTVYEAGRHSPVACFARRSSVSILFVTITPRSCSENLCAAIVSRLSVLCFGSKSPAVISLIVHLRPFESSNPTDQPLDSALPIYPQELRITRPSLFISVCLSWSGITRPTPSAVKSVPV